MPTPAPHPPLAIEAALATRRIARSGNRRFSGTRVLPAFALAVPSALVLAALLAAGCSRGEHAGAPEARGGAAGDARAYATARPPYRVVALPQSGTVSGSVALGHDVPRDTTVLPFSDQRVCGDRLVLPLVAGRGRAVGSAVVWIDDVRAGKPLPVERRFELTNRDCLLDPQVLAAVVGGTLNVKSADPVEHRTRFVAMSSDSVVETVRHYDAGQVVPLASVLARPARLEVRCDLHPFTRGWLQVFDHPYFAVTTPDGRFRLDSVPPGTHTVRVWHPRLGTVEATVTVQAGREATVAAQFP